MPQSQLISYQQCTLKTTTVFCVTLTMITYNPDLENFVDGVNFDAGKPCVWVVYPPGCAGDLLASIINFHYIETGAKFRGINGQGQVIFRSSDQKYSNQLFKRRQLTFDDAFFFKIDDILSSINLNWSKMDQFIFSNHCYSEIDIRHVLSTFKNCKIIRLLPKTQHEQKLVEWLAQFKNKQIVLNFPTLDSVDSLLNWPEIQDHRVLTVYFSDLISSSKFDSMYTSVLSHLDIGSSLVRYDFVQDWITRQHPKIQECIVRLTSN